MIEHTNDLDLHTICEVQELLKSNNKISIICLHYSTTYIYVSFKGGVEGNEMLYTCAMIKTFKSVFYDTLRSFQKGKSFPIWPSSVFVVIV